MEYKIRIACVLNNNKIIIQLDNSENFEKYF